MEPYDVPDANATVLYVGNLDRRVTDQMMLNILRTGLQHIADKVLSASMFPGDMILKFENLVKLAGHARYDITNIQTSTEGYCFVQFQDNNSACQAMTFLNGREFCGKKVKVNWATNSSNGGIPKVIGTSVSIYCGNLDDDITETDLKSAFEPFGEILNVKVVRDPVTNKSKNIGFISFTNKPDAEKAIRDMHGAMLKTRPIKTNWATRNQNQKREELDYDETFKASATENCTVYVGGIPNNATDDVIRNHFDEFGKLTEVRIFTAKNYAFVRYETHEQATNSICKTNGTEINGSILKVWWGKDGPEGTGGGSTHSSGGSSTPRSNNQSNSFNPSSQMNLSQYNQMTPEQQQQYMQYMSMYNPYYQQQYYQYWMQQYQMQQMQMQQNQQGGGGAAQQQFPGYQQQQQQQQGGYQGQNQPPAGGGYQNQHNYPPQSYQN